MTFIGSSLRNVYHRVRDLVRRWARVNKRYKTACAHTRDVRALFHVCCIDLFRHLRNQTTLFVYLYRLRAIQDINQINKLCNFIFNVLTISLLLLLCAVYKRQSKSKLIMNYFYCHKQSLNFQGINELYRWWTRLLFHLQMNRSTSFTCCIIIHIRT